MKIIIAYLIIISAVAIIVTAADKLCARKRMRRVSEKALLILGALGGAIAMFITMQIVRHKTKKIKFMLTLPLFSVVHVAVIFMLLDKLPI